jgi:hypothetical protein
MLLCHGGSLGLRGVMVEPALVASHSSEQKRISLHLVAQEMLQACSYSLCLVVWSELANAWPIPTFVVVMPTVTHLSHRISSSSRLAMFSARHTLFRCTIFNTALCWCCLHDEGHMFHNKQGRLPVDTEDSDTPPVLRGPQK